MGYFLYRGIEEKRLSESSGLELLQVTEFKERTNQAISDLQNKKITNQDFKRIIDTLVNNLYKYFGVVK